MIPRQLEPELRLSAKKYPVVTVMGPRQSGKTTLVRNTFKAKPYVNLEIPETLELAEYDPKAFFSHYPEGAIIDEIQKCPKLLSYIQGIVDESDQKGQFILTGSQQLSLSEGITQSLAGRTAVLTLLPLTIEELKRESLLKKTTDEILLTGFFPRIYRDDLDPVKASGNYIQTYLERDVRQLINLKDFRSFQRFLKLCAGRIGQLLNYQNLSNEVGVSSHTIKHWIAVLEMSFIIHILPPYFGNIGKRTVKSPKLYFTDTGIASYLLDIRTPEQLNRDPLRGSLFENLVVNEMLKNNYNLEKQLVFYFFRDSSGKEVDLLYKEGANFKTFEVKSSSTFHKSFYKNLHDFEQLSKERSSLGTLVYSGDDLPISRGVRAINFKDISTIFEE
ncbi:MAG: ATP-binding protein [Alphaproteobacteria bacterium]|jgi:uncharacterized protein|nr:ATP-binding protein [Alphaproteobacteria bacterium]MBT5390379.1 ATP-binding protein [Alphaproteobacteria bacterium]MBT5540155.1 ATP-binding protein [Alphaproteobacteria bacterium]